ncbi:MAG TPA: TlpA disulfide reductase family protein [Ktedonobacterales bacterium]|jgi:peroxiredoxin
MAEQEKSQGRIRNPRQTRLMKWVSVGAAVVVAGLIGWGLLISRPASGTTGAGGEPLPDFYGRAGQAAPDFTLKDLRNAPVSLSDFRGERVLVNFWYVACPGCQTEMLDLERFAAQERGEHLVILGINIVDDANTASLFLQQYGITYPVVLDTHQRVLDLYQATSTPSSFLIDSQGIIRGSVSGPLNLEQMQAYFAAIH